MGYFVASVAASNKNGTLASLIDIETMSGIRSPFESATAAPSAELVCAMLNGSVNQNESEK
jgi:hypothetical protein